MPDTNAAPGITITISEPLSVSIQAICNATIAICHTIDAQTAAMTDEERKANSAFRIEALKPVGAAMRAINKLLGIE